MKRQSQSSRPLRLAILTCTGGAGHLRAAQALMRTATALPSLFEPVCINVLDHTPAWFRRLYAESYLQTVQHAPDLWGYLYQKSDAKPYRKNALLKAFDRLNYTEYLRALKAFRPDAVLGTHFLPYISVGQKLRQRDFSPFVAASVTDFDVHRLWVDSIVQRYYVFHEETSWQLQGLGIPAKAISTVGIPLMPEFSVNPAKRMIRRSLGIPADHFVVLVLSGGFGVGRLPEIVRTVVQSVHRVSKHSTVVAIAGRNESARRAVALLPASKGVSVVALGYVDTMHDWMAAADIVVTKSGGLTSAEALARQLPMVVMDPIPGQESRNADLIIAHGAGAKAVHLHHLEYVIQSIIRNPRQLSAMRRSCTRLGKPHASLSILKDLHSALKKTNHSFG